MTHLKGEQRADYVQTMFGRIAHRYDLLNRLMTVGQDVRWRRELIRGWGFRQGSIVLDTGAGTGDLALEIKAPAPGGGCGGQRFYLPRWCWSGKQRPGAESVRLGDRRCHAPAVCQRVR